MQPPIAYLNLLPVELWLRCWMFASTRQRRRLSLVCRLFRSLCFLSLISPQSADIAVLTEGIDRHNWVTPSRRLQRAAIRLERLAGTPLVLAVRAWKISSAPPLQQRWTRPLGADPYWAERFVEMADSDGADYSHIIHIGIFNTMRDKVLTRFRATLGIYQNLLSLNIRGMTIDMSLRQTVASLPRMKELILDGCDIAPLDGLLLKLQHFTISATAVRGTTSGKRTTTGGPLEMVYAEHILELNLHAADQSAALITGFGGATLTNLRTLSLHALFNFDVLLDLLKRSPRLESLTLPSIASGTPLPTYLPPQVVPLLRNITTSLDLV
jgi:hypothetical protein